MANENKLTTLGQMRELARQQDARDDVQEEQIQQLEEDIDAAVKYTEQTLTDEQKAQARANIGAAESTHTHKAITTAQIDEIMDAE